MRGPQEPGQSTSQTKKMTFIDAHDSACYASSTECYGVNIYRGMGGGGRRELRVGQWLALHARRTKVLSENMPYTKTAQFLVRKHYADKRSWDETHKIGGSYKRQQYYRFEGEHTPLRLDEDTRKLPTCRLLSTAGTREGSPENVCSRTAL